MQASHSVLPNTSTAPQEEGVGIGSLLPALVQVFLQEGGGVWQYFQKDIRDLWTDLRLPRNQRLSWGEGGGRGSRVSGHCCLMRLGGLIECVPLCVTVLSHDEDSEVERGGGVKKTREWSVD